MAKDVKKDAKKAKVRRPQAQKRDIQNTKKRMRNKAFKSSVKTAVRRFEEALEEQNAPATEESLRQVYSLMDRGVKKGVFSVNKAGRTKARLTAQTVSK